VLGRPPPLAWLGGCCEPTDLLRRLRMRAVMSRAPPAGGSWWRSRWPRRVRRRSRPAGIPLGCFHLGDSRIRLVFLEVKGRWGARPGTIDRSARATAGGPSDAPGGRWAGRPGRLAPWVLVLASWREQEVSGRRRRPRGGWPRDWPR